MPMRPLSDFLREDEFGRGELALIGPDGPSLIIEIEMRVNRDEIHVGLIVGV